MFNDATQRLRVDEVAGCTELHMCEGQPTNRQDLDNMSLGIVAMTPADYDITKDAATSRYRLLTVAKQIAMSRSGRRTHYALATVDEVRQVEAVSQSDVTAAVQFSVGPIQIVD